MFLLVYFLLPNVCADDLFGSTWCIGVDGNLWAVAFDLSRLETVGDPVPVQEGVLTKASGTANFSVSENGSLVYVPPVIPAAGNLGS